VDIELVNDSSVPHAVAIDGVDATSDTVTGGTATLSTELEPGEYTYFCPVGNHRDAGMEGTLTVE
jgi:plastocyanin